MVGLRNIEELESDEPIVQYSEEELHWLNSSVMRHWLNSPPSQHTYSSPSQHTYSPRLFLNENRSEEENPNEDFGMGCSEAAKNIDEVEAVGNLGIERTGDDCVMVDQLNSECIGKKKTKEKNPIGERRNKKTNGVRIAIPLEDILQTKGMRRQDAAKHLKGKGKFKEKSPGGERGNKGTTGVRLAIAKEDILQTKGMCLNDAAELLQVSRSTFKRVCREHNIYRCPPRKENELIGQSGPNESPAVVDHEQISQLNSNTLLPSNQVPATIDTNSVKVKVWCEEGKIKFKLSSPWRKEELEQKVKNRMSFEAETYNIYYKDKDDDDHTLIKCDEDLEECISSSSRLGTHPIELILIPKYEFGVDQL